MELVAEPMSLEPSSNILLLVVSPGGREPGPSNHTQLQIAINKKK